MKRPVDFDFHPPKQAMANRKKAAPRIRAWLLLVLAALLIIPLFFRQTVTTTEAHTRVEEPSVPAPPEIKREVLKGTISSGDSVTSLLGRYFTPQEIHQMGIEAREIFPLSALKANQPYRLHLKDDDFERFEYDIDREEQLFITRDNDEFIIEKAPIPYTKTVEHVSGTIETSLFEAVAEAGEDDALTINLADIFAWDIDFILDIRKGDSFRVLVEKRFRDGEPAGYGKILAADFTNQGKTFEAIRYVDGDRRPDFYDAEGNSLRKAFLKAPLAFSRISSGFTMRRYHPITKTWKAHPAIDYAAPRGTPIKTVGDGTVIKKGYTRGNGNYIKIRHNSSYETLYLHMSKFARGISKGKRVVQGQVIGYVGSTGLATGPHLCFRMRKNGAPVNPSRVKAPATKPISAENMESFKQHAAHLLARLENGAVKVASTEATKNPSKN